MLAQEALIFSESSFIARMVCSTPLAVFGLVVGVGRMVRGIGGVAGDFLGGGAEFVDRRGDAVGAVGLLVGVGHRRVQAFTTSCETSQFVRGPGDFRIERWIRSTNWLKASRARRIHRGWSRRGAWSGRPRPGRCPAWHDPSGAAAASAGGSAGRAGPGWRRWRSARGDGRDAELAEHGVGLVLSMDSARYQVTEGRPLIAGGGMRSCTAAVAIFGVFCG